MLAFGKVFQLLAGNFCSSSGGGGGYVPPQRGMQYAQECAQRESEHQTLTNTSAMLNGIFNAFSELEKTYASPSGTTAPPPGNYLFN